MCHEIEVGFGLAPDLKALLDQLPPTRSGEWYSEFLLNFATGWSRSMRAQVEDEARERLGNVVSLRR